MVAKVITDRSVFVFTKKLNLVIFCYCLHQIHSAPSSSSTPVFSEYYFDVDILLVSMMYFWQEKYNMTQNNDVSNNKIYYFLFVYALGGLMWVYVSSVGVWVCGMLSNWRIGSKYWELSLNKSPKLTSTYCRFR